MPVTQLEPGAVFPCMAAKLLQEVRHTMVGTLLANVVADIYAAVRILGADVDRA